MTPVRSAVLVAALAVVVYLNVLPNPFVIDDQFLIVGNGFLREPGGLKKIFTTNAWASLSRETASNYYRPLMHSTLYLWWRISRDRPAGYHALSLLLHAAVSVLVLLCLRGLYSAFRIPHSALPLVAALLFAVHPIHTEAVGWISAFPDLQCSFFVLLGFWLYLRAEQAAGWRRHALDLGVGACLLLGLLAKEIGMVLPLMAALYTAGCGERAARWRSRALVFAAMAAALAVYLAMRRYALGGLLPYSLGFQGPPELMYAGWIALIYQYTALLVYPIRLSSFHVMSDRSGFFDARVLAGFAAGAAFVALGAWLFRRRRPEWLAVPLLLIPMALSFPATTLRGEGFRLGERFLYLASVGFCWLLAAGLVRNAECAVQNVRRASWIAVLGLLAAYSLRTVQRNYQWRDEIGFYLHELDTEGESPVLRALLMEAYVRRGLPQLAEEHARGLVRLAPRDPFARNSLGFVYWTSGEREKALEEYGLAAEFARERGNRGFAARALNNIAVAYSNLGRLDLAIPEYRKAVELDPLFAQGHNNLGAALYQSGKFVEAVPHLREAVRVDPALAQAHSNLGLALAATGNLAGARAALAEAIRLEPGDAEAHARAGEVALLSGDVQAARQSFARALALDPGNRRALLAPQQQQR